MIIGLGCGTCESGGPPAYPVQLIISLEGMLSKVDGRTRSPREGIQPSPHSLQSMNDESSKTCIDNLSNGMRCGNTFKLNIPDR